MHMAAVSVHGTLAVGNAADEGKTGVEDGQAQHQEGHGKGDNGIELEQAVDRHHRQDITQEGGAGVAHEDLGGVHVVGQKADTPAGQGGHEQGHVPLADHQGDDQQRHGADGGDTAGQAVQAVDQVDGVGDGNDPQHRHRDGQPAQVPVQIGRKDVGIGQGLDDVARQHRHQGGTDLDQKLQLSAQSIDIVKNTQHYDDGGAQQHSPHLGVQIQEEQYAEQEAQVNGKASHPGNRMIVHPAVVLGHVHRAHLKGQALDHRRGNQRHQKGHHQSGRHHPQQGKLGIDWHRKDAPLSLSGG